DATAREIHLRLVGFLPVGRVHNLLRVRQHVVHQMLGNAAACHLLQGMTGVTEAHSPPLRTNGMQRMRTPTASPSPPTAILPRSLPRASHSASPGPPASRSSGTIPSYMNAGGATNASGPITPSAVQHRPPRDEPTRKRCPKRVPSSRNAMP